MESKSDQLNGINKTLSPACTTKDKALESDAIKREKSSLSYQQKVTLVMLAIGDFMSVCSMSIISPFFPAVSAGKGVPGAISGLIFAVYALVVFLSSPVFGKVLPKLGAKPMFTVGALVAGVANITFGLVDRLEDYTMFVAASFTIRIVEALGAAAYSVAAYVLIVDLFPNNLGTVRGLLETFIGLGLSAGPGVGGLLYTVGGFSLPFFVTGGIAIIIAFVNMYVLPPPKKDNIEKGGSLISLLRLPPVFITCVITIVMAMSASFLDPTLEPHLRKTYSLTPSQVGLLFILSSATYGITSPFWGWVGDKFGNYTFLMGTGLFGTSLSLFFMGPSPVLHFVKDSVYLNAVSLAVLGVSIAMALIPTYQYILECALDNGFHECIATHSTISGLWSSVYSLGEVIGPILGGTVMEQYDFPVTSSTMAAVNLFLAIIGMVFFKINSYKKTKVLSTCLEKQGVSNVVCCVENGIIELPAGAVKKINEEDLICVRL